MKKQKASSRENQSSSKVKRRRWRKYMMIAFYPRTIEQCTAYLRNQGKRRKRERKRERDGMEFNTKSSPNRYSHITMVMITNLRWKENNKSSVEQKERERERRQEVSVMRVKGISSIPIHRRSEGEGKSCWEKLVLFSLFRNWMNGRRREIHNQEEDLLIALLLFLSDRFGIEWDFRFRLGIVWSNHQVSSHYHDQQQQEDTVITVAAPK